MFTMGSTFWEKFTNVYTTATVLLLLFLICTMVRYAPNHKVYLIKIRVNKWWSLEHSTKTLIHKTTCMFNEFGLLKFHVVYVVESTSGLAFHMSQILIFKYYIICLCNITRYTSMIITLFSFLVSFVWCFETQVWMV